MARRSPAACAPTTPTMRRRSAAAPQRTSLPSSASAAAPKWFIAMIWSLAGNEYRRFRCCGSKVATYANTRSSMFRVPKVAAISLALTAAIALTPASAFARGGGHAGGGHPGGGHFGHGGGPGLGFGFYPYYGYYPNCVWVRRLVPTPRGLRWRQVPVCN